MNVVTSIEINRADRVWYDASSGKLFIQARDYVNGIEFSAIPDSDFDSTSPVRSFSLGQSGSVVVCRHENGKETWLPVDMWEPGGFTPPSRRKGPARPRRITVK